MGGANRPGIDMRICICLLAAAAAYAQEKAPEQKQRDCGARAAKVFQELRGPGATWRTHYSVNSNRCLVAILSNYSGGNGAGTKFARYYWELVEAFSGKQLAVTQWDGPADVAYCRIEGVQAECLKARMYIENQLKQ